MFGLRKMRFVDIGTGLSMMIASAGLLAASALHAGDPGCAHPSGPGVCNDQIYLDAAEKLKNLNPGCCAPAAPACAAPAPTHTSAGAASSAPPAPATAAAIRGAAASTTPRSPARTVSSRTAARRRGELNLRVVASPRCSTPWRRPAAALLLGQPAWIATGCCGAGAARSIGGCSRCAS